MANLSRELLARFLVDCQELLDDGQRPGMEVAILDIGHALADPEEAKMTIMAVDHALRAAKGLATREEAQAAACLLCGCLWTRDVAPEVVVTMLSEQPPLRGASLVCEACVEAGDLIEKVYAALAQAIPGLGPAVHHLHVKSQPGHA